MGGKYLKNMSLKRQFLNTGTVTPKVVLLSPLPIRLPETTKRIQIAGEISDFQLHFCVSFRYISQTGNENPHHASLTNLF